MAGPEGDLRVQLEVLRRQVEEDYRLDIAAIEHLERRFFRPSLSSPGSNYSSLTGSNDEPRNSVLPPQSTLAGPQSDELVGSLRTMFGASDRSRK